MKSGFVEKLLSRLDRLDRDSLQSNFLRLVEELHADFEAKRIDFDTFEERKMELFARITVD